MPTDPARRLERAVVDLSTQVRRIADAMTTPTDDAPSLAVVDGHPWTVPAEAQPDTAGYEFREALLVLLSRAARGVLTADEGPLLRQHVEHLLGDRDQLAARVATLEHVAAGNKRHVQMVAPELERAEAALARVLALADRLDTNTDRTSPGTVHPVAAQIRAAIDGTAYDE